MFYVINSQFWIDQFTNSSPPSWSLGSDLFQELPAPKAVDEVNTPENLNIQDF